MSAQDAFARLAVELRHATAEAVAIEEAMGGGEAAWAPDLQRIDYLRQHLSELRAVLESLRDGAPAFDIRQAAHAVSLGEVRARLRGEVATTRQSGAVDLF